MKYTTLLLDADDTLFDFPLCEFNALKNTLESSGFEFSQLIFESFDSINTELWRKLERSEITRTEVRIGRFRELIKQCLCGCGCAEELSDCYINELSKQAVLIPGSLEAVRELAVHFDLYIITNGLKTVQRGRISVSPVTPYIKDFFISEEIDVQKPKKEFFDIVMSRITEKDKSKVLVVGDSLTSDMQGGRNAGIDTCLFDPNDRIFVPHPLCDYKIHKLTEIILLADAGAM